MPEETPEQPAEQTPQEPSTSDLPKPQAPDDIEEQRRKWLENGPTQLDATEPETILDKLVTGKLHLTSKH